MALNVALGSYSGHGEHSEAIKEMVGGGGSIDILATASGYLIDAFLPTWP